MPPTGDSTQQAAAAFVEKWSRSALTERAASHEHFLDLCHLLEVPTPATADATGEDYCFEKHVKVVRSASKGSKGDGGFVDVWRRGCFAWEYKQKDKYKELDNPPLSVVCNIRKVKPERRGAGVSGAFDVCGGAVRHSRAPAVQLSAWASAGSYPCETNA